jgi:hypothetical protein
LNWKAKADAEDSAKEKEEAYIESLEPTTKLNLPQGNGERRKSKRTYKLSSLVYL